MVVWIHAAQPVLLRSPDSLHALFDRWPDGVRFYDVPTTPGPNAILQGRAAAPILPLSRRGSLADDLSRFFGEITTGDSMRIQREQTPREVAAKGEAREVSERLEKLFAYETVLRLCRSGQQENREAAVKLATQAKLVTPVTGAVVLETKEQYDRAGLEQADDPQAGSPSMGFAKSSHGPEPTWFVLLAVVAGAAGFAKWNRRRAGRC